jgi:O-6-methylguanine DNA methyltransferase
MTVSQFEFQTQEGPFFVQFSKSGLSKVSFPVLGAGATPQGEELDATEKFNIPTRWLDLTFSAIREGVFGQPLGELPPLDLQGTPFQRSVWAALLSIPRGKTRSYGQIAVEIGRPGAMRAVGRACGANPVPLIVPCHRVLAAGGKLGGFSGGEGWKPLLLAREGWGGGADLPLFKNRN